MSNIESNNEMKNKIKKIKKLYQKMYTELISLLWEITDLSARIKSLLSDYTEAGKLILKNIDRLIDKRSLSKYENDDIIVTREKVKLIQALWSAHDYVSW